VEAADRFQSGIQVQGRGRQADAKSIMGVLSLGAQQGDTITIHASGADAEAAITALSELIQAVRLHDNGEPKVLGYYVQSFSSLMHRH
jgi:phosphotransferase system HPr (HPr) family protein